MLRVFACRCRAGTKPGSSLSSAMRGLSGCGMNSKKQKYSLKRRSFDWIECRLRSLYLQVSTQAGLLACVCSCWVNSIPGEVEEVQAYSPPHCSVTIGRATRNQVNIVQIEPTGHWLCKSKSRVASGSKWWFIMCVCHHHILQWTLGLCGYLVPGLRRWSIIQLHEMRWFRTGSEGISRLNW